MKTFVQFLTEGDASDFSYAPDQMGEDICMPGASMFDASRLMPEELEEHLQQVDGKWALVSKKTGKPLRYFRGEGKPSPEWVSHAEKSVQYWKHHG